MNAAAERGSTRHGQLSCWRLCAGRSLSVPQTLGVADDAPMIAWMGGAVRNELVKLIILRDQMLGGSLRTGSPILRCCTPRTALGRVVPTNSYLGKEEIMPVNYSPHGGKHRVAVVHCPEILGKRLGHLSTDGPSSWVLRDFITGQMIRNSPAPNHASSSWKLDQIEATVTYSESPPFRAYKRVQDWERYLRWRTSVVLGIRGVDYSAPNPKVGKWEQLA